MQTGPAQRVRTDVDAGLQTMAANTWQVWMRTIGSRLYVWGNKTLVAYNLDKPEDLWHAEPEDPWATRDDGLTLADF